MPRSAVVTRAPLQRMVMLMQAQRTLSEIKAVEATRRQHAVEDLKPCLRAYARAHNGRYYLFGSAARQEMRAHSDVDIMVDFAEDDEADAWCFAEEACAARGLVPDIMRRSWSKQSFIAHIMTEAEEIA
ncbi:MAG TPA: nucleotidyltransferase domain-containing protein [Rhodopila sp.]|nr:nucleotidyltransferase domain-containing protein [Rhodopila sp.]